MPALTELLHPAVRSGKTGKRWLAEFLESVEGAAVAPIVAAHPEAGALLAGIAEGSPYLRRIMTRWPEWLPDFLETPVEASLSRIIADTHASARQPDFDVISRSLRHNRARTALLVAMADLGGVLDTVAVTEAITDFADAAVQAALRFGLNAALGDGDFTAPDAAAPERDLGLFVLALGKHGARELNYSSDIDLTIFYDPGRPGIASARDPQKLAITLVKGIVKLLNERTADGYVERVDLRLRPDPGLTPIAMPVHAALGYYESVGQNWERAAMIKARPIAGDIDAGHAFLKELDPFIWRKYFDYAAIADIHAMKR